MIFAFAAGTSRRCEASSKQRKRAPGRWPSDTAESKTTKWRKRTHHVRHRPMGPSRPRASDRDRGSNRRILVEFCRRTLLPLDDASAACAKLPQTVPQPPPSLRCAAWDRAIAKQRGDRGQAGRFAERRSAMPTSMSASCAAPVRCTCSSPSSCIRVPPCWPAPHSCAAAPPLQSRHVLTRPPLFPFTNRTDKRSGIRHRAQTGEHAFACKASAHAVAFRRNSVRSASGPGRLPSSSAARHRYLRAFATERREPPRPSLAEPRPQPCVGHERRLPHGRTPYA